MKEIYGVIGVVFGILFWLSLFDVFAGPFSTLEYLLVSMIFSNRARIMALEEY